MPIVDGHLVINGYTYEGGDGSDKDHAIEVSTFKQLMDADNDLGTVTGSQYYIKIVADLYPSHEDWFTGFITKVNWRTYIFCAEGNRKKIDGMVVSGASFMTTDRYPSESIKCEFENIDIINNVFYGASATSIFGPSVSGNSNFSIIFEGCQVSVKCANISGSPVITNKNCRLNSCSFYVTFDSSKPSINSAPFLGGIYQSNVVVENVSVSWFGFTFNCFFQQSSFIFKNCSITSGFLSSNTINTSPPQSYVATINCTYSGTFSINIPAIMIVASDATPYPFTLNSASTNKAVLATTVDSTDPNFNTSSVKSKQFMIDCGFLP